jgi:drug/metabolite transporter (DMT)-like permease
MANKSIVGHLAIFSANLIYGANYSIAKLVMPNHIKPFGFILLRVLGATLLFWLSGLIIKEEIAKEDYKRLFWCGFFGVALNQLMFFAGLNLTVPINASIIMICTPVLVVVISHYLLKEKFTWYKISGITLGIAGALLLILSGKKVNVSNGNPLGDFFILINASSFAIYLVIAKPLIQKYHVVTISKWMFLIGLILVTPFGFKELGEVKWEFFTPRLIWATAFVVIAVTYLAYLGNNFGLKKLNPGIVSFYIYLQPFLAALVAMFLGTDKITIVKVSAAIIIFTGIYLISIKQKSV